MQIVTSAVRIDVVPTLPRSALVARRRSLGAIASKQIFCSRDIQARVTPLWVRAYKTTVSNDVVKACRQSYRLRQSQLCTQRCSIRCVATRKHNIAGMHQLWNTYVYKEMLQAVKAGADSLFTVYTLHSLRSREAGHDGYVSHRLMISGAHS